MKTNFRTSTSGKNIIKKSKKKTILFQGDSVTDCARCDVSAQILDSTGGLGAGYAFIASAKLQAEQPACGWTFLNRGIGGNKVADLLARWRCDALSLKPNVISILIGVNDCAHRVGEGYDIFEKVFRLLIEMTRSELPSTSLVLCEPFARETESFPKHHLAMLKDYSRIVRNLATENECLFVPFQELFDDLFREAPGEHWLPDGVHPSAVAHFRMADFWLKHCRFLQTELPGHHVLA